METQHEMNFFELCVACARAIGRGCAALGSFVAKMLRLTYRYWWLVIPIVVLATAGAIYHTRRDNLSYRVNAIAFLNGPTITQFEEAYASVQLGMTPSSAHLMEFTSTRMVGHFTNYRVIDCLNDETPDYIDYKRKSSPTDTVKVQMHDRLCLQFQIKHFLLGQLPQIEDALMEALNSNEAMQQAYVAYLPNLQEKVAFNHRQAQKLDSLTSSYYFYNANSAQPMKGKESNGVNFYGDRRIHLFLKEIYQQQAHLQNDDYRLMLANAPVVLENHFAVDPKPVCSRMKCTILFFLLGWFFACVIAEMIDKRKVIFDWLKK
ncbi:MAG: hypothetical protein K6A36_06290 [Paludibacteraceae bacterium]|nr:hypothetical protein [Paludibacteraceae bacterium]